MPDKKYLKLKMMGLEPLVYKPVYNSYKKYEIFTIVDNENLNAKVFAFLNGKELTVNFREYLDNMYGGKYKGIEYDILEGLYPKTIRIIFKGKLYSKNYDVCYHERVNEFRGSAIQHINGGAMPC